MPMMPYVLKCMIPYELCNAKRDVMHINARHCYFIAEYHIREMILCDNHGVMCDVMGTHDVTPAGVTSHFT